MSRSKEEIEAEAKKNREQYPEFFVVLEMFRAVFGEDCKLIYGVSVDGKTVGKEPSPGYFEKVRKEIESRQQAEVQAGGTDGASGSREGHGSASSG